MFVMQGHYVLGIDSAPDFGNFRPQVQGEYSQITGGRGGSVYRVTSLDGVGTGAGTIRGARTLSNTVIVFECAGYIDLQTPLTFTGNNITLAGQTAPEPGIHFRYTGSAEVYINFEGTNIICQHFSVRAQFPPCNTAIECDDNDAILDHISICWHQDEGIIPFFNPDRHMYWRCLLGEALFAPSGSGSCSGGGMDNGHGIYIYNGSRDITMMQCLLASISYRCPQVGGRTDGRILNNLLYNIQTPMLFQNQIDGAPGNLTTDAWKFSAVGNRIIRGPVSGYQGNIFWYQDAFGEAAGANQIYRSDNTYGSSPHGSGAQEQNDMSYDPNVGSPPTSANLDNYSLTPSNQLESLVLAHAGSRPKFRSSIDQRIVNYVSDRTAPRPSSPTSLVSDISQVGGFPSIGPVTGVPWSDHANPNVVVGPHGRTNRDLLLEQQALALEN